MRRLPQRKSPRLTEYDYSQDGAYFVTICSHNRANLFGNIIEGEMHLNSLGIITAERWLALPDHHSSIQIDTFVIMPNHIHGIIMIAAGTGPALSETATTSYKSSGSLSTIIGSYKSSVSRFAREKGIIQNKPLWQSRFYDHVIRNAEDLDRIREYILYNPAKWAEDNLYTD